MAPGGLWWDRERHKHLARGDTVISKGSNVPAQRCFNCNMVIIPMA